MNCKVEDMTVTQLRMNAWHSKLLDDCLKVGVFPRTKYKEIHIPWYKVLLNKFLSLKIFHLRLVDIRDYECYDDWGEDE